MPEHWGKDRGGCPWLQDTGRALVGWNGCILLLGTRPQGPSLWGLTNQGGHEQTTNQDITQSVSPQIFIACLLCARL